MKNVTLRNPDGSRNENPSTNAFKDIYFSRDYWMQGSGGATLEVTIDGITKKLLILPNSKLEIYLKLIDGPIEWLSLGNSDKLDVTTECLDEWIASVGLFLPRGAAWFAVEEFLQTGKKSNQVSWITAKDIPETGNY